MLRLCDYFSAVTGARDNGVALRRYDRRLHARARLMFAIICWRHVTRRRADAA